MTMLSSTVALPSTWAAAGLGSNGNVFAVGSESKFESTGNTTATGVIASNGGQVTIASLDTLIKTNCLSAIANQLSLQAC